MSRRQPARKPRSLKRTGFRLGGVGRIEGSGAGISCALGSGEVRLSTMAPARNSRANSSERQSLLKIVCNKERPLVDTGKGRELLQCAPLGEYNLRETEERLEISRTLGGSQIEG